ncbi:GNAT family N-acetyltransferase [Polynucleobacter meluiroseus]|nr:GNAT family N-acetyltransferase [Polynucleobacter meluiroseus]
MQKNSIISLQDWQDAEQHAYPVREAVFILEQGVPEFMEIDEFDALAKHALIFVGHQCIATGRLLIQSDWRGQIGRMAVMPSFRQKGFGRQLLNALLDFGQTQGLSEFILHAQISALPFYEKAGFIPNGPIYQEAGIPHRNMTLTIATK